jgi:biopolymer transport protein ExbD/biopolymer transport protein TolR
MAMSVGGSGKGVKAEINITPLVDVVLVLLIIFMVITPMLQRGKDVRLPGVHAPDKAKEEGDPLILSVTQEKKTFLEQDELAEAALEAQLKQEFVASPNRRILLKGDERLTYGDVRKVMEVARKSGAKGISLGVEELKDK